MLGYILLQYKPKNGLIDSEIVRRHQKLSQSLKSDDKQVCPYVQTEILYFQLETLEPFKLSFFDLLAPMESEIVSRF